MKNIFLVERDQSKNTSDQVSLVAHQLNEYFDCEKFLQKGEEIIINSNKLREKFNNFLSRYNDLKPSTEVSQSSISDEKKEIEEFSTWF